jgi:hypothetical protein
MAFDRAAAKEAGYSDAEIDAYLQANPAAAKDTPPAPATADTPPPPSTVVPEIDRTASTLGTAGLGVGAIADVAKDIVAPAATAYGAYKVGQVANAAINKMSGPVAPTSAPVGSPGNPIGGPVVPQSAAPMAPAAAPAQQSMMSRASQLANRYAPVLRAGATTAGRMAGPAGMAYGVYESAPELAAAGGRLNTGQAQTAMRQARQAPMNMPTPAPLTATEAKNLLDSGDERTINIYGGRAKLMSIIQPNAINSGYTQELARLSRG